MPLAGCGRGRARRWSPRPRLAALALAASSAAAWDHAPNALLGPHGQPATFGQDSLACGTLLLPEQVLLAAQPAAPLQRAGAWRTPGGGATLASWAQQRFRWSPDKVYYYRGAQQLFKTDGRAHELDDGRPVETVELQDCQSVRLYTLVVRGGAAAGRFEYDVLGREGDLLARGRYNTSDFFPEQLLFTDAFGLPVAVAQSPALEAPAAGPAELRAHQPPEGSIRPWQVSFYGASTTNSSLMIAEHRWVITAAVQDHAIRTADASRPPTDWRWLYVAVCALALAAASALASASFRSVYSTVYPPAGEDLTLQNPFLKPNGSYGSLGPPVWERKPTTTAALQSGALAGSLGSLGGPRGW